MKAELDGKPLLLLYFKGTERKYVALYLNVIPHI